MLKLLSKENKEALVGIVFLLSGFLWLLFFYNNGSKAGNVAKDSYIVNAHFNKADGILVGDDVRVAGLPVGKVSSITLNQNFGVSVKIILPKYIKLPEDSSASIHTSGFFGRKYIEIDVGGMEENIADNGTIIYTQDSMLIEDLLDRIIAIGRSLRGISSDNQDNKEEQNES